MFDDRNCSKADDGWHNCTRLHKLCEVLLNRTELGKLEQVFEQTSLNVSVDIPSNHSALRIIKAANVYAIIRLS